MEPDLPPDQKCRNRTGCEGRQTLGRHTQSDAARRRWAAVRSGDCVVSGTARHWSDRRTRSPPHSFCDLVGLVYLIAFVSLWTQIDGLVGDQGILPVADFLDAVRQHFATQVPPASPIWNMPTLLWISPHDGMLQLLCATGTVLALMVMAGICRCRRSRCCGCATCRCSTGDRYS